MDSPQNNYLSISTEINNLSISTEINNQDTFDIQNINCLNPKQLEYIAPIFENIKKLNEEIDKKQSSLAIIDLEIAPLREKLNNVEQIDERFQSKKKITQIKKSQNQINEKLNPLNEKREKIEKEINDISNNLNMLKNEKANFISTVVNNIFDDQIEKIYNPPICEAKLKAENIAKTNQSLEKQLAQRQKEAEADIAKIQKEYQAKLAEEEKSFFESKSIVNKINDEVLSFLEKMKDLEKINQEKQIVPTTQILPLIPLKPLFTIGKFEHVDLRDKLIDRTGQSQVLEVSNPDQSYEVGKIHMTKRIDSFKEICVFLEKHREELKDYQFVKTTNAICQYEPVQPKPRDPDLAYEEAHISIFPRLVVKRRDRRPAFGVEKLGVLNIDRFYNGYSINAFLNATDSAPYYINAIDALTENYDSWFHKSREYAKDIFNQILEGKIDTQTGLERMKCQMAEILSFMLLDNHQKTNKRVIIFIINREKDKLLLNQKPEYKCAYVQNHNNFIIQSMLGMINALGYVLKNGSLSKVETKQ